MKKILLIIALTVICKAVYPQFSNVTLVSKWAHGREFNAVYVSGNYAYVATDSIVTIVDITNPSLAKGVGQFIVGNNINWIYVTNSKAYVAQGISGLCIVDVSNPRMPVKMGACATAGKALTVKVSGNYAYVAADTSGMRIIDISNPNVPVEVSFFDLGTTTAWAADIAGNYAYIAYGTDGLRIVDISNPLNPVAAGFLATDAQYVFISGNRAYLRLTSRELSIVNITNPSLPIQEGTTFGARVNGNLVVSGNYAYIITSPAGYTTFEIWDISNSFAPVRVNSYLVHPQHTLAILQQLSVSGSIVFFLEGSDSANEFSKIDIVDVTNPSSPLDLGNYRVAEYSSGICTSGNYVYEGGWAAPGGEMVSIIDITDPHHPQEVGFFKDTLFYDFGNAYHIVKSGNYLYMSDTKIALPNSIGVKIIDVSNPANPFKAGTFAITSAEARGIAVNGNYAYVCYGGLGLIVVDVSNQTLPVQVGSVILSGGFEADNLWLSGNYAYVIDNSGKMHIINITNPIAPAEVGSYQLVGTGSDIFVEGNYAYVAVGSLGFQIIDVSVPSTPVLAGAYTAVSNAPQVEIYKQGNYVYLADYFNGMQVINVSNPANPVQVGYYYDCGRGQNIYADNLHSYLIAYDGLYIFEGAPFTSTGTQLELNNQLSVFPNPFESSVTITSQKQATGIIIYSLKNIQGQVLYNKQETGITHPYSKTIDLNFLPKGIYLLDVTIDEQRSVKKIVKI